MNGLLPAIAMLFASANATTAGERPDSGVSPQTGNAAGNDATPGCPTPDAVAKALAPALAPMRAGQEILPPDFRVVDLGSGFEITAAGQTQRYADPAHDCAERARVAAVFVALTVSPPSIPPRRVPPPPAPPVLPPVLAPAPRANRWLDLGVAGRLDIGVAGGRDVTTGLAGGGELRIDVGQGWAGLEATAGVLSSTESAFGSVKVSERRFPCSLSATVRRRAGARLQLGGGLGVALAPLALSGQGLAPATPVTRLDVGGRVAFEVRVAAGAVTPFASLHVEYFPRPYEIAVDPLGQIGTTAPLQIGLSLGVALEARR